MPLFHKVVELDPKSPGAHLNLGIAMADQFDLNGALAEFTRAVQLDANNAQARYNRGRDSARLAARRRSQTGAGSGHTARSHFGRCMVFAGPHCPPGWRYRPGSHCIQEVACGQSEQPETLYMLGQELQRKGDIQGARQMWEKAIEIRPQYSQAIYSLSRLLAKSDPERARQLQARFERLQSDQHIMDRAQSLGNFALASADAHDWQQAIAQLKEAIAVCGECSARPQLHKDLGLIYCHSGSLSDGRAELLEAKRLTPGDQDVEKALRLLDAAQKTQ